MDCPPLEFQVLLWVLGQVNINDLAKSDHLRRAVSLGDGGRCQGEWFAREERGQVGAGHIGEGVQV